MKKFYLLVTLLILVFFQSAMALETYEFVTMWGSCGSGDYQFGVDLGPRGLAVDNGSNLYVADYGNQKIKAFSTSGTFKYSFSPGYVSDVDYAGGYLYFTKPYGYACKYTVAGTKVWEKYFSAPGWNLNGICVDSDGNVHVCNSYYNKVYKLNPETGNLIKEYSVPEGCWQIASDNSGHVYIVSGSGPVQRYTNDGVYDNSKLNLPPEERVGGIDVDDQGNIFMGTANYKMRKYDSNWNLLAEWGEQGSGQGQFSGIGGATVDDQGLVYVSDGGGSSCTGMNRRIQVFKHSVLLEATITADPSVVLAKDVSTLTIVVTYIGNPVSGANVLLSCSFGTFEPNNEHYVSGSTNSQGLFEVVWISSSLPIILDDPVEETIHCDVEYLGQSAEASVIVTVLPTNTGVPNQDYIIWQSLIRKWEGEEIDELWRKGKDSCFFPPCELTWVNIYGQKLCEEYLKYYEGWLALQEEYFRREQALVNIDQHHQYDEQLWNSLDYFNELLAIVNQDIVETGAIEHDRSPSTEYGHAYWQEFVGDQSVFKVARVGVELFLLLKAGYWEPLAEDLVVSAVKGWFRQQWGFKTLSREEYQQFVGLVHIGSAIFSFDPSKKYPNLEALKGGLKIATGALKISGDEKGATFTLKGEDIASIIIDLSQLEGNGKLIHQLQNDDWRMKEEEITIVSYPNPFNLDCHIEYTLPQDGHVRVEIFNILGQKVKTLVDQAESAGKKSIYWDGRDENGTSVASGVYFYRLETGKFVQTKKMLLLK